MRLMLKTSRYETMVDDKDSDTAVITFSPRHQPAPAPFFGDALLANLDVCAIYTRSLGNDWYIDPDFSFTLEAIRGFIDRRRFKKIVCYGASMGSYGALRYADALGATRVIAAGPVVDLSPAFERRWTSDYQHLITGWGKAPNGPLKASPTAKGREIAYLFDPHGLDAKHVETADPERRAVRILLPHAGHLVLDFLKSAGLISSITRTLLFDPFTPETASQVENAVWRARKSNRAHFLSLADRLRSKPKRRTAFLAAAVSRLPRDRELRLQWAEDLAKNNDFARSAEALMGLFQSRPRPYVEMALIKAAVGYLACGGDGKMIADILREIDATPQKSREFELWRARYLRHVKRYDAACRTHRFFMKGDVFDAQGHHERGLILTQIGLRELAREEFRAALRADGSFRRAANALAALDRQTNADPPIQN